jgi:hypothetical protein
MSTSRVETTDCYHVIVRGHSNIGIVQCNHCPRLAGRGEELYLESALGIKVNDSTEIARAQSVLWDITSKDDLLV